MGCLFIIVLEQGGGFKDKSIPTELCLTQESKIYWWQPNYLFWFSFCLVVCSFLNIIPSPVNCQL